MSHYNQVSSTIIIETQWFDRISWIFSNPSWFTCSRHSTWGELPLSLMILSRFILSSIWSKYFMCGVKFNCRNHIARREMVGLAINSNNFFRWKLKTPVQIPNLCLHSVDPKLCISKFFSWARYCYLKKNLLCKYFSFA